VIGRLIVVANFCIVSRAHVATGLVGLFWYKAHYDRTTLPSEPSARFMPALSKAMPADGRNRGTAPERPVLRNRACQKEP